LKKVSLIVVSGLAIFAAGWGFGKLPIFASGTSATASIVSSSPASDTSCAVGASDTLRIGASSTSAKSGADAIDPRFDLFDPKKRTELERTLREMPYSLLKQVFLERQDSEFEKSQERYPSTLGLSEEELDRRIQDFFEKFQATSDTSYFVGHGEWKLRGGRSVEVQTFAHFYPSKLADPSKPFSIQGSAQEISNGKELCWYLAVYVKIGESYAHEGTSTCLPWTSVRDGHPYALLGNYSKSLTPYFDSLSVPLPGFGDDAGASPEWYDSTKGRWTGLSRIRWDGIERTDYQTREKRIRDLGVEKD
jgi:hypothetical protein